jgi:hypothetical protein
MFGKERDCSCCNWAHMFMSVRVRPVIRYGSFCMLPSVLHFLMYGMSASGWAVDVKRKTLQASVVLILNA